MRWIIIILLFATQLSARVQKDKYNTFRDNYTTQQKQYLAQASTATIPNGYLQFEITCNTNNTNITADDIYILITTLNPQQYISFTNINGQYLGQIANYSPGTYAFQTGTNGPSYQLSTFPLDSTTSGYTFYLPITAQLQACRIYYSVNGGLDWFVDYTGTLIQDTGFSDPSRSNYYTIYDKQEFTIDVNNNRFVMNPTLVDYYGMPLSFQITSGGSTQYSGLPPTLTSSTIFSSYASSVSSISNTNMQNIWSSLNLSYQAPSDSSASSLRILSPGSGIQAPNQYIPKDYFLSSSYTGCSWLGSAWYNGGNTAFWQTNTPLYVDLSVLGPSYGYATGIIDGSGNFNFTVATGTSTGSTATFPLPNDSTAFFTSDLQNYSPAYTYTGDANVPIGIWQALSASIITGISPFATSPSNLLSQNYVRSQSANYFENNSNISCQSGVWYDFYSKTLLSLGSGNYTKYYTTPYADYLGIDGTVTVLNLNSNPIQVISNIADMSGINIPDPFNDTNQYTVIFSASNNVIITFGTNPNVSSNPVVPSTGQTYTNVVGSTMYVGVQYQSGNYNNGTWYSAQLIPSVPSIKPGLPLWQALNLSGGVGGTLQVTVGCP